MPIRADRPVRPDRKQHGKIMPLTGAILNSFGQEVGRVLITWNDGEYGPDQDELIVAMPLGHRILFCLRNDRDLMAWSLELDGGG